MTIAWCQVRRHLFDKLIDVVASGKPVWIVATVDFQVPKDDDWLLWETDQGSMYVTPLIHSAVITGFDREKEIVYVNDPYGYQNREVDWSDLEDIYKESDQQSLYLEKNISFLPLRFILKWFFIVFEKKPNPQIIVLQQSFGLKKCLQIFFWLLYWNKGGRHNERTLL